MLVLMVVAAPTLPFFFFPDGFMTKKKARKITNAMTVVASMNAPALLQTGNEVVIVIPILLVAKKEVLRIGC